MKTFHDAWQKFHPDSLPLGHLVRDSEIDHWLRFHSLPESKRYAESEAEMTIILERQNIIASEVIGSGAQCWLITSFYVPEPAIKDNTWLNDHQKLIYDYDLNFSHRFSERDDDEIREYDCFAALTTWQETYFNNLLRDIADDKLRALWMSVNTGAIFAPYDGGVDLILPDVSEIARLRTQYSDWLSSHPSGF